MAAMRPPKAAPVVRKFSPWDDLMDEGEMANGCGAIRDNIRDYLGGEVSAVVIPLNDLLLLPLDAYIQRCRTKDPESLEAKAAEHFFEVVRELEVACGQFSLIPSSLSDGDDERWHNRLIIAWAGLLGANARKREYDRSGLERRTRGRRGKIKDLTAEELASRMKAAGVKILEKAFVLNIAAEFYGPDFKLDKKGYPPCKSTLDKLLKTAKLNPAHHEWFSEDAPP